METKVKQLHTSVSGMDKENSSREELVKRKTVEKSPFEIISIDGKSFGAMGQYRVTEPMETVKEVEKELKKITWDRLVQVVMILQDLKNKTDKK
tara:strand:+ start:381 stop:662 length:282 start_codon:yes stop_codon:yes gene_type:complete